MARGPGQQVQKITQQLVSSVDRPRKRTLYRVDAHIRSA